MTDPIRKADALQPETSPLDAALIASIVAAEVARLQADPDSGDIVDALTARLPILSRAISAARVAGAALEQDTSPQAIARKAAGNRAAKAAADAKSAAWSKQIEHKQNLRAAAEAVGKCREGLTRAQAELARMEKSDTASDRDTVLCEGSVALWTDRLSKAEQNLATIEKGQR